MSTQENTIKNDELDLSSATEVNTNTTIFLTPGAESYIRLVAGRNYHLVATNIDEKFDLTFLVDDYSGSGPKTTIIPPRTDASMTLNSPRGIALLGNITVSIIPGRPGAAVSIYSAQK
jgi:hypothetical protein